jgi:hypothetical protein
MLVDSTSWACRHPLIGNTWIWSRWSPSSWAGKSRAGLIQLEPILGSPRIGNTCPIVDLGSHRCSWPVRATRWLALSAPWPRDRFREETKIKGPLCKCQRDKGTRGRVLYRYFKPQGFPAQNGHRSTRGRAFSPFLGRLRPDSAQRCSYFLFFLFLLYLEIS